MHIRQLWQRYWAFLSSEELSRLKSVRLPPYAGHSQEELAAGLERKLTEARAYMREKRIERAPTLKLFPPPNSK
jgi:hypothetical protein